MAIREYVAPEKVVSKDLPDEQHFSAENVADQVFVRISNRIQGIERSNKQGDHLHSHTRLTFYLFVSALLGFVLLRALTDQEVIVALGTLNIAIIGMWIWALLRKARALTQSLTPSKGDLPEV